MLVFRLAAPMPEQRRLPPSWSVEELKESFVAKDATGLTESDRGFMRFA